MNFGALQNGSDIRGIALAEAGRPVNLTEEAAYQIGGAFVSWLADTLSKPPEELRIGIGRDSRLSGPALLAAAARGMADGGATVWNTGLASTPAMFFSTITPGFQYDGAVMVTASHLPFDRNGLKFFIRRGGLEKADIQEILKRADAETLSGALKGKMEKCDFMSVYSALLVNKIRQEVGEECPLTGRKIVVDAGNGAGGFFVEQVLKPLGANTAGSQFLKPDGRFPNHIPNPEDAGAVAAVLEAVEREKAELGILFDTDVDRAGAVDGAGHVINKNRLIALLSAILLKEHPGTTIVTDSVTSSGLTQFIRNKGGVHHRFKRGYKNVINEAIRLNAQGQDAQLAIETSGHGALKENYFLDDGAYLMVKLLIEMARQGKEGPGLASLIEELQEPAEEAEYRLPLLKENFKEAGQEILNKVTAWAEQNPDLQVAKDNYEGIRASLGPAWFLLRLSLHEPLMPLNLESDAPGGIQLLIKELLPVLKGFDGLLDSKKLEEDFC